MTDRGIRHLQKLPHLQCLYLSGINLSEEAFTHFESIASLRELACDGCGLGDVFTNLVRSLRQLQAINLCSSEISDRGVENLCQMRGLRELYIDDAILTEDETPIISKITDDGLRSITNLTRLQAFSASWTAISDQTLRNLQSLTDLRVLRLAGTSVTDAGLTYLRPLTRLAKLDLLDTKVNGSGLKTFGSSKVLKVLDVQGTEIDDEGLEAIGTFEHLEYLDLMGTQITDAGLIHLHNLKHLRFLCLLGCRDISVAAVAALADALPFCYIRFELWNNYALLHLRGCE